MITLKNFEILENLKLVRALIEKPEHWTQNTYAKTVLGLSTHSSSEDAFCFCTLGAINHVLPNTKDNYTFVLRSDVREALEPFIGDDGIADFNDTHTHEEVIEAFDKAIKSFLNV